jgi:hypothetical protein
MLCVINNTRVLLADAVGAGIYVILLPAADAASM